MTRPSSVLPLAYDDSPPLARFRTAPLDRPVVIERLAHELNSLHGWGAVAERCRPEFVPLLCHLALGDEPVNPEDVGGTVRLWLEARINELDGQFMFVGKTFTGDQMRKAALALLRFSSFDKAPARRFMARSELGVHYSDVEWYKPPYRLQLDFFRVLAAWLVTHRPTSA